MSGWQEVRLGDICEFAYGKSLPAKSRTGQGYPVYGSNGVVGFHDQSLTSGETIVVGRKGSFGEVQYSESPCWPIDTTYYITEDQTDSCLPWLAKILPQLRLTELNRAAAIPGLNREDAYRQRLFLPPLEEQRRIAIILDAADALRAKRRESLAQLDALLQSTFLDLFGDPDSNGWEWSVVEDVAEKRKGAIRTGPFGSQLLHSEFVDSGVPVLGIDNVVSNEFREGRPRFITADKYERLKRYTVHPGDVLITIMGTCGRCAIVPDGLGVAINTKHLCCISLNKELCLPEFMHAYFLLHPTARRYLEDNAKGAIMSGLNMGIIKALPIPLPPIDLQDKFAKIVQYSKQQKARLLEHNEQLTYFFASLQQRAFSGEL